MDHIEALVKAHSHELFAYLYRMIGNRAQAEDLLGEVFVKLIEQVNHGCGEGWAWRPWLYRVAGNCAISHLRKQKLRSYIPLLGSHNVASEEPAADAVMAQRQTEISMQKAIGMLGNKHKEVLIMRMYQDLSYDDIAAVLKINVGTVKSRINAAKKKLRGLMEVDNEQR